MAHPQLTKPILVDRWVPQPNFSHAKHQVDPATQKPLECNVCHQATQSRETSDVLMRAKANWITCHPYHAPIAAERVAQSTSSVKEMLLRKR
jgi:hypothetical protein